MRLALVSPLPPAPTGVADYAADLIHLLAGPHQVEVFHGQERIDRERLPADCLVRPASELPQLQAARPYDVVIHQMGNSAAHGFVYDLLPRLPGLLVLHDVVLFHSRAAMITGGPAVRAWLRAPDSPRAERAARPWLEAWRDELRYSHPAQAERLFQAHLGTVGDLLPYAYPLCRIPVETSKAVLVHSAGAAAAVREEVPGARVFVAPLVLPALPSAAVGAEAVARLRESQGFGPSDLVVGVFGLLTREKRIEAVARAVARATAQGHRLRLLLAGPVDDRVALEKRLASCGLPEPAVLTGRIPLEALPTHVAAADIVAHLRWPTGRESSAALLRVMAQGKAVIMSDLTQQTEIPEAAVRRIDLAEEESALVREIAALAADAAERGRLGEAAAAYVREQHRPERVLQRWHEALEAVRRADPPARRNWPGHWSRPIGQSAD